MKSTILDKHEPVLRAQALAVPVEEIASPKIQKVIAKMKKALHTQDDGVAIAAPQIGESLRIFVVKSKLVDPESNLDDLIFINPEIIKKSQKKVAMEEGCLSCRWLYGEVMRHEKVSVKAYNEKAQLVRIDTNGLMSQIMQHEIDHLNGILFIDKAKNLRDLPPEELAVGSKK